ncbi:hypothetical protein [Clostridium sporogenes]|nr:hypothetical protein [Clostridium sporogenes]
MKELDMKEAIDINGGGKYKCSCGWSSDWYVALCGHLSILAEQGHRWV